MEVHSYLRRIGIDEAPLPGLHGIAHLHAAHLLSVPFENLGIHAGDPTPLEDRALLDKAVARNRGGFCYELNGAFRWLLRAIGVDCHFVSAQVAKGDGKFTPLHDHMAILIPGETPLLADVGFGDSFRYPLRLVADEVQSEDGRSYRFARQGERWLLQQKILCGDWVDEFRFTTEPVEYPAFHGMWSFHYHNPESHFRKAPLATLATPDGRITLSGTRFIETTLDGTRTEHAVETDTEFDRLLLERFGIASWRTAARR